MSITDTAKALGVSRPAASNFFNGKAAASPEMAARLQRVFGILPSIVLDMQTAYDTEQVRIAGGAPNAVSFVPPFLQITANQIEDWADRIISARTRLSVLLRMLVHSTGIGLKAVDFPGNDDAERPGWDGRVDSTEGTPWIPGGLSGWEFGVNVNVKGKADGDFEKSVKAVSNKTERCSMEFVFVTPRRWPGKASWAASARSKGLWRDVRAYDATDIEQWLEQSLPAQTWLANELNIAAQGVRSLDKCWSDWAGVANPPLSETLFGPSVEAAKRIFSARMSRPPEQPIVVAADSVQEALAFLAQLFADKTDSDLASIRDRVLVFEESGVLPRLALGAKPFVPVAPSRTIERELAPFTSKMHSIVVCPRNATNANPDFILEPIDGESFRKGLESMGMTRDIVCQHEAASGRSLTVLRRRLSTVPAVRTPEWAADYQTAGALIPMMFVGAWHSENASDREALSLLADRPFEEIERDCQRLTTLNDAPLWSIAYFRGVVSKIDLLFAIAPSITQSDLKRYFEVAKLVLGEDDPSLDLEESDRWFAAMRGKVREFSGAFRKGISETLVLLAVHGDNLFINRIGINCAHEAQMVVRNLLPMEITVRMLQAHDRDLPTYAEAAPQELLTILENDLRRPQPVVLGLLKPVGGGPFSSPTRTGLLWALEGLAWNPGTLLSSALILARLAEVEIDDNWVNKPINSLKAIFRSWMPQTAANHDQRLSVLQTVAARFPSVGWAIAVDQFSLNNTVGHYSHKPQWRTDGFGFGEPFPTTEPIARFQREMVEMALSWSPHSLLTLSDLVQQLNGLDNIYQSRVWAAVRKWAMTANDDEKVKLRETVRVSTLSYGALRRAGKRGSLHPISQAARDAYVALEPSDTVSKYEWLFMKNWVEESFDELHEDDELDFNKREIRIAAHRSDALREIFSEQCVDGLIELAKRGEGAAQIGWLSAKDVLSGESLTDLARCAVGDICADDNESVTQKNLLRGLFAALDEPEREVLLRTLLAEVPNGMRARLVLLAPFGKSTWSIVETLNHPEHTDYWDTVVPTWLVDEAELTQSVTQLLDVGRPRAAFASVNFHSERISGRLMFRVLDEIAKGGNDRKGEYPLAQYNLQQAFKIVNQSNDLSLDQKAGLEFAYLDGLSGPGTEDGTPNLERYIELHPDFFVNTLVWAFKRRHGGIDPTDFTVSEDRRIGLTGRAYALLEHLSRLPGHNDLGQLEIKRLRKWIDEVRAAASDLDRTDIADQCVGKLLSKAPVGRDGVWPCEEVRDVMEAIASIEMVHGAQVGKYNSRGAHWRGEGGAQERAIADQYRGWAEALRYSHPFVSSKFLMGIVDTYEAQASREDTEAGIRRRLR